MHKNVKPRPSYVGYLRVHHKCGEIQQIEICKKYVVPKRFWVYLTLNAIG